MPPPSRLKIKLADYADYVLPLDVQGTMPEGQPAAGHTAIMTRLCNSAYCLPSGLTTRPG